MIPKLFSDCNVKKGFVHSRLRRYVPHRIGIEFECFGDFANEYLDSIDAETHKRNNKFIENEFGILQFSQDCNIELGKIKKDPIHRSETKNEIRVSIQDYSQLNGLYNILNEMAKYCAISQDCGIHIHVDLTKYGKDNQKRRAVDWFSRHLSDVESIFPKYTGTYNKRIAQCGKGSYVNLSAHDTVEFRIAPLTFDYELLITWIVKCCKLVSRMISECHLDIINRKVYTNKSRPVINLINPDRNEEQPSADFFDALRSDVSQIDSTSRFFREMDQQGIDWWTERSWLMMTFPDGITVRCRLDIALHRYQDGGLDSVLRVSEIIEMRGRNVYSASTNSSSGTYNATWNNIDVWEGAVNYYSV
jgi:hypothetical protein